MPSAKRVDPKDQDEDPLRSINGGTEDIQSPTQTLDIGDYFFFFSELFRRGVEDRHPTPEPRVLAQLAAAVSASNARRANGVGPMDSDDDEEDNRANGGAMVAAGFEGWQLHNQYNIPNAPQQIFADEIDIAMANRHRLGRLGANIGMFTGSAEERRNILRDLIQVQEEVQREEAAAGNGVEDENGNIIENQIGNIPDLEHNRELQEALDLHAEALRGIIADNNGENMDDDYDAPS